MGPEEGKGKLHLAWPKTTQLTVFIASDPRVNVKADFLYAHKQQENALPEVSQSTHPSTVKHEFSSLHYQQSTSLREMPKDNYILRWFIVGVFFMFREAG